MTNRLRLLSACTLALAGCRASPRSAQPVLTEEAQPGGRVPRAIIHLPPADPIRAVVLVDSAFVEVGTLQRYLYRIGVRHDSSVDTLPGIVTVARPTLVGDSLVLGVAYDSTSVNDYSLFRYTSFSGHLEVIDPPSDLRLTVSEPAFSPDGQYLAYIAFPGDATGSGVIRRWPSSELLLQTPSDSVPATDVTGGWAHWADPARFELYMVIEGGLWVRFRGTVQPPVLVTDTVAPTLAR